MPDPLHLAVSHDHVGPALQDRKHQPLDIAGVVLIVGVGIHDDVRPQHQARLQADPERSRQPLMSRKHDHVVDTALPRDFHRPVRAAVVDHQHFHDVDPGQRAGQPSQSDGKRLLLVQARDLDDQLHAFFPARSLCAFPSSSVP